MKTLPYNTETFFKKAILVAECYGFQNIEDLQKKPSTKTTNILGLQKHKSQGLHFEQHVLADIIKRFNSNNELKGKQPLLFYTPSTISPVSSPSVRINALTLNTVGTNDPLAEIILLKSATSILKELGIKNFKLRINCIGDKDSSARFIREVSIQLKNRVQDIPEELLIIAKTDPAAVIAQLYNDDHPLLKELPSSIEHLTSPSRKYFKEILELLDSADIPFELSDKLYADPKVYSHSIFEIVETDNTTSESRNVILARGGRYDELTRPYVRSAIPSTGIVIAVRTTDKPSVVGRPRRRRPNACIVHIGKEARLRSIDIIESFREKKIPVEQCLYFERFSEQMAYAHAQKTKYIIIIGQQEARDGVVLVRDTDDHSQQTIPIHLLPEIFKCTNLRQN